MFKPTAFVLLAAGLAVAQPPADGVSRDDVKRLAERLQRLDLGSRLTPSPKQLEDLRKLLEANPEWKKQLESNPAVKKEIERQVEEFKKLPPDQQQAKLDQLQGKTPAPAPNPSDKKPPALTPPSKAEPPSDAGKTKGTDKAERLLPPQPSGKTFDPDENGKTTPPPPKSSFTPNNPNRSGYERFVRAWEQNVGKIEDMPALQKLAKELFTGKADPDTAGSGGPLAELFDTKKAGDLLKGLPEIGGGDRGGWKLPDIGGILDDVNRPNLTPPSASGLEAPGVGGVGLLIGLLALAGLLVVVLKYLPKLTAANEPRAVPGLGPWPLDPRRVETRADVVRAFEYLSVLINGHPARAYSHEAAATALREAVPTAADAAEPLAAAYALARYTPVDQPMTADQIAAARRHLCRLAGVPAA